MTVYYHSHAYSPDCDRDPDHAHRRHVGGCGGWNSYDGPCGAEDCPDCFTLDDGDDCDEGEAV